MQAPRIKRRERDTIIQALREWCQGKIDINEFYDLMAR